MSVAAEALTELLKEVRRIHLRSNRLVTGAMAGSYKSVFRGSGIEFEEVREYVPGDDPRAVDWNVTARTGKPYVKTYVDERDLTAMFIVDLSASMKAGFGAWSGREMAARVVACLALSAVKNNDRVGFIAFGGEVERFLPPRQGTGQALRIIRDCLEMPSREGATDLASALDLAAGAVRSRSVVFVVSDFLASDWERSLALCARRHDVIAVRLTSPPLPEDFTGLIRVCDPESGSTVSIDWGDPAVRTEYHARLEAARRETEHGLRRARVDLLDAEIPAFHHPDAVTRPITRFFRMRQERGARR